MIFCDLCKVLAKEGTPVMSHHGLDLCGECAPIVDERRRQRAAQYSHEHPKLPLEEVRAAIREAPPKPPSTRPSDRGCTHSAQSWYIKNGYMGCEDCDDANK